MSCKVASASLPAPGAQIAETQRSPLTNKAFWRKIRFTKRIYPFHDRRHTAMKGNSKHKARTRERNTGGSSLRKRDPTCPGALYDKCSVFPALEDKQEGFCRGKMSFASTFSQELRRVVPPSHSVPCSKFYAWDRMALFDDTSTSFRK